MSSQRWRTVNIRGDLHRRLLRRLGSRNAVELRHRVLRSLLRQSLRQRARHDNIDERCASPDIFDNLLGDSPRRSGRDCNRAVFSISPSTHAYLVNYSCLYFSFFFGSCILGVAVRVRLSIQHMYIFIPFMTASPITIKGFENHRTSRARVQIRCIVGYIPS